MNTPQFAKLQELIATATNPKQKAMYESLLKKMKTQSSPQAPTPIKPSKPKRKILTPEVSKQPPQPSAPLIKPQQSEPVVEQESDSEEQSDTDTQVEFQGIGLIKGEVNLTEERSIIKLADQEYRLFYIPGRRQKAYNALQKEIEMTGNPVQRLIVYPKLFHFPRKEQPHKIGFQLVGFVSEKNTNEGIEKQLKDGEFRLCGLWQFIPVCRVPCISIFRNFNQERLAWIKEAEPVRKVKFMKASHIPMLWKDSPVKPFRFNPKLDKEEQGKPKFVQVKAKFLPGRDLFGFVEQLAKPIENSPRFLKASKKDKAIAKQEQAQS